MKHIRPISIEAQDDRLAFVGTPGSGKTYGAGVVVEDLLGHGSRACIVDPLGVWWGLRSTPDGKRASPFDVVIFGGAHGDLPITEHAGALVGETVASMRESCIVDLSDLGTKASERRFMNAMLSALYKNAVKSPLHLIFDEADMWAPQRLLDKEGEAAKLLGMMETVVRRGRVKGFIPWLITQRPAVLSKNVLSMIDGLVVFKLVSSQDRDAIGDWVEGSADKQKWKEIWESLPTRQRGEALVWLPARGVMRDAVFPTKRTFDSSASPKRGERRQAIKLQPIDISAVRGRLAAVEQEVKANDPRILRTRIAELERAGARDVIASKPDSLAVGIAYKEGIEEGKRAVTEVLSQIALRHEKVSQIMAVGMKTLGNVSNLIREPLKIPKLTYKSTKAVISVGPPIPVKITNRVLNGAVVDRKLSAAERKFLTTLAQRARPLTRNQIAVHTGYSSKSSHVDNTLSRLRTARLISGSAGAISITDAGIMALGPFDPLPTGADLRAHWLRELSSAERKMLELLFQEYPHALTRNEIAERTGFSAASSHVDNTLSRLRTLMLIEGEAGAIRANAELME